MSMMGTLDEMLKLRYIKQSLGIEAGWRSNSVLRTIGAKLTGKHYVTAGAALQGRMFQAALKAGVEFRTEAAVSELIVENGAVNGVVAMKDGKPWPVRRAAWACW